MVALTQNNDISKDYEEILTIQKTPFWEVLNEDLDETKDGIQIQFEDGVALVSVAHYSSRRSRFGFK